tara:strand:- start:5558 stop:6121 length:564 start_codon:yes stop_codon:yes gene_type:complete
MISHTHNFIFIHIPKTGGSSIDDVLKKYVRRWVLHEYLYPDAVYKAQKRNGFKNYFSFCFVRNPWDKIVSQYHFNREYFGMENYTFEEYVHAFNEGKRISWFNPDFLSWMTDDEGNVLMDFVGRFEKLQEDFDYVCDQIKIPKQELPHHVKTEDRLHYTEYYNQETQQIIADNYANDIKYFNYEFGI